MPIKDNTGFTIGFTDEDGFHTLGKPIEACTNNIASSDSPTVQSMSRGEEFEFDFDFNLPDRMTATDLKIVLLIGIFPEKIVQNNWRKMHGLPMKRRLRNRKYDL